METLASRYASIRTASGLSKKAFAESLGIHPVVSGDIELGKREPSRDVLVRLAHIYKTDISWLLTGKAVSIQEEPQDPSLDHVYIDLYEQEVAAGRGAQINEYAPISRIPIPASLIAPWKSDKVKALEVRGDSMIGIGLNDQDIVLFAPGQTEGEGIYVISIGSVLLVKRIQLDPRAKAIHIISENPRYPMQTLYECDFEDFKIEGRVIAWIHRC